MRTPWSAVEVVRKVIEVLPIIRGAVPVDAVDVVDGNLHMLTASCTARQQPSIYVVDLALITAYQKMPLHVAVLTADNRVT